MILAVLTMFGAVCFGQRLNADGKKMVKSIRYEENYNDILEKNPDPKEIIYEFEYDGDKLQSVTVTKIPLVRTGGVLVKATEPIKYGELIRKGDIVYLNLWKNRKYVDDEKYEWHLNENDKVEMKIHRIWDIHGKLISVDSTFFYYDKQGHLAKEITYTLQEFDDANGNGKKVMGYGEFSGRGRRYIYDNGIYEAVPFTNKIPADVQAQSKQLSILLPEEEHKWRNKRVYKEGRKTKLLDVRDEEISDKLNDTNVDYCGFFYKNPESWFFLTEWSGNMEIRTIRRRPRSFIYMDFVEDEKGNVTEIDFRYDNPYASTPVRIDGYAKAYIEYVE